MDDRHRDLEMNDANGLENSDDDKEVDIGYHSMGRNIKVG